MDFSYDPHAERARRKTRSTTYLNHMSLAPLTSKLPFGDSLTSDVSSFTPSTSYLQEKSTPTTPRLLVSSVRNPRSRSRSQGRMPLAQEVSMIKSKSSSNISSSLSARKAGSISGSTTPRRRVVEESATDGDWLLRTGALMSSGARKYKGQSWLVSRQSSASLTGMRNVEDELFEQELAQEREMTSRQISRRGSMADEGTSRTGTRAPSRLQSRSNSIVGGRSRNLTPLPFERGADEGFLLRGGMMEPDFVDLDAKLEELERDTMQDDEADVKRFMRRNTQAKGSWLANMIGWSLFSVEEHEEDSEDDSEDDFGYDEDGHSQDGRSSWLKRHCEGPLDPEDLIPPPETNQGGWSDAAWLLSVATKVIF